MVAGRAWCRPIFPTMSRSPFSSRSRAARFRAGLASLAFCLLAIVVITQEAPAAETRNGAAPKATAGTTADTVQELFDGKSLAGWMKSGFDGEGEVRVEAPFKDGRGAIIIEAGVTLSGITWTKGGSLPRTNYEIAFEAMRLKGDDFFCGLTFPVGKSACTFIVGGWSGMVVGISSIDGADASENETTAGMEFEDNRWYRVRVRVTPEKIQTWIDQQQFVDLELQGRTISLRPGDIQHSLPLGIATYMTSSAVRDIQLRRLRSE
jgi:hypothetical protein